METATSKAQRLQVNSAGTLEENLSPLLVGDALGAHVRTAGAAGGKKNTCATRCLQQ